ncbi:BamA/TamA family outer membrane protein [Aquimarina longa]|uniref:translocation and assembly module lipoprotein TamL n=1 Tax=Aquimarina longa TaxID=1080221 RepID=UPI000781E3CD|nr:BamA/TamA family outer membrane protein [Aquimarina longa]
MKDFLTKILLITITTTFLFSCNAVKKVPEKKILLDSNKIFVDSTKIKDPKLYDLLYQKPNIKLLGIPIRLHIYNLARINQDSLYKDWLTRKPKREKRITNFLSKKQVDRLGVGLSRINEWLKSIGEPPSIINESKIKRSIRKLQSHYWNNGWFNVKADYKINTLNNKTATVEYYIKPNRPYFIDSLHTTIVSKVADSIYKLNKEKSTIISGKQYKTLDIETERDRLTYLYRNSGLFHFEKEFIKFDADTIGTDHKVNLNLLIKNRSITSGDSINRPPFKIHKISTVNIYTDYSYQNRNKQIKDSTSYKGYNIYAFEKIKYTRRSLTNAVLITPGEVFRDNDRTLTYNQINNLKTFKYPNIKYEVDPNDSTKESLIANILLTPRKKYSTGIDFDASTSNIQTFGIGFGGSLLIRNVFGGAEILEISGRGSIGSSSDVIDVGEKFFNISEVGIDVKLSFPKILFPFRTHKIIPKHMSPTTNLIFGMNAQENIGLDRQNATGVFNYLWKPNKTVTNQIDFINIQYVRNLNTSNYFNIYNNSFDKVNTIARQVLEADSPFFTQPITGVPTTNNALLRIPDGINQFIFESLFTSNIDLSQGQYNEIQNILERKTRLTDDNLIFASNYTYTKNNRENLYDESYSRFRAKIEFAGNTLSAISNVSKIKKNSAGRFDIFGVEFSQYAKTELDYIKHWDLGRKTVVAFRAFTGIALPYGNANSIPFTKSFFGGGPNDNRAWRVYDLGPGSTGGRDEFNEGNMKIAFNTEYRYNILGSLNGALFIDAGNIWNVLDNLEDEDAVFSGLKDLKEIAIGSGFGFRYDFNFFVLRLDVGFKTFNPANDQDNRWFKGYNFSKAIYNFGINYPF